MATPASPVSLPTASDLIVGSSSDGGRMIVVSTTSAPGTLLHKGSASGQNWSRVTVLACNNDTVERTLTLMWGTETFAAGDVIVRKLAPQQGLRMIVDRATLRVTYSVYAYASTANVINCMVEVQSLAP